VRLGDRRQSDELPSDALAERHRLHCKMSLCDFKEELRRDATTVRGALDEVFREIERQEGRRL
jgi:hypothetical protein